MYMECKPLRTQKMTLIDNHCAKGSLKHAFNRLKIKLELSSCLPPHDGVIVIWMVYYFLRQLRIC
jgi:hypothetical protein